MRYFVTTLLVGLLIVACNEALSPPPARVLEHTPLTDEGDMFDSECPIYGHPECWTQLRPLTVSESAYVEFVANHVNWYPECQTMKYDLRSRLWNRQIRAWDGSDNFGRMGDFHPAGQTLGGEMHLWQPLQGGYSQLNFTLLHEAAHSALGVGGGINDYGDYYANLCWLGD